jgi:hypothetical protein
MTPVDPLERLLAIEDLKQLKARYFRLMDQKRWSELALVFTHDAVMDADGYVTEGRQAIIAFLKKVLKDVRTVHHGHMPEITILSPISARAVWAMFDYVEFPSDDEPQGLKGYGHYDEEYVVEDGLWRIKRLKLTRLRIDPLEGGLPEVHPDASKRP